MSTLSQSVATGSAPSLAEARAYCRRLATSHYENFTVASWLLPRPLRQHFYNVYAYCRTADDLADESPDPRSALAALDHFEAELDACYAGRPRSLIFIALAETIRLFDIPRQPFADLLVAFRQDQSVSRYESFEDLLGYCRYSANPVGRLVLYLCGYRDDERQRLSDFTCTALQLANFWQDVKRDFQRARVYLPLADMRRFEVSEQELSAATASPAFRALVRFEVERAREWFHRGLPLVGMVGRELAVDIELFTRGGQAILDAIAAQEYDVLRRRPRLSTAQKTWLVLRAAARKLA